MELLKSVWACLVLAGLVLGAGVAGHIMFNVMKFGWNLIG